MGEKWRELYTERELEMLQQLEIRNLKVLIDVCEKLDIRFFLYGGSLIGAVRHQGFVPWDDDLDIAMMRTDYMRFIREAPRYLPEEYYLQTPYTDKKTPYLYTKLRLKGTRYIEYAHHRLDIEQGIYVDIYPIDNLPDDEKQFARCYTAYQKLAKRYVLRQSPYPSVEGHSPLRIMKNMARYMVSMLLRVIPQKRYVYFAERIMTKYNHVDTGRKGNWSYFEPTNIFEDILPFEKGCFEGIPVWLPGGWDQHLTARYGNYRELPPEENRIGHRPYILDFGEYAIELEKHTDESV